jgi:hypothetical protein
MKKIYSSIFSGLCIFQIMHGQPTITSLSPIVGPVGSTVVISGTGFNATNSLNTVYFGATKALVNNASASSLTVAVPFGANNFPVSVLNNANNLTAYSAEPFKTNFFCPSVLTNSSLAAMVGFSTGLNNGIAVGDFDGDGKSDMAACMATSSTNGTVSVFRSISVSGTITNTSFAPRQDFLVVYPTAMAIADIDGDGKLDIVTCSFSNNNGYILKNTSTLGSISFASPFLFTIGASGPNSIAIDDLDMDGKPEIVIADNFPGKISVIKNNSTPGNLLLAASVDFTAISQPNVVAIADIDGDGKKDIAATNSYSGICVYRNTTTTGIINSASFASLLHIPSAIGPSGLGAQDLDGDSKIDLVITGALNGAVEVYRNTASPGSITLSSFAAPITYTTSSTANSLSLGDLNGDGKAEIVLPLISNYSLSIFQNTSIPGNISFSLPVQYPCGGGTQYPALGDLDNDGRNDLLVTTAIGSVINTYRNLMGLKASASVTSVSCNGGNNGQILLNAITVNTTSVLWSNSLSTFSINNLVAGVYNYTLTSGICVLTQSVNVQQPAPINLTTSSSNSVLCEGQTATLTVSGATTYSWSGGSATASIAVSPSVTTNYLVTGTLNGCPSTATVTQVVSVFTLNASSSPTLLCEGETATLSASGALTYTWTGISSGSGVAVNPSITTVYTLNANNSDGCLKTTTLAVDVSACTKLSEEGRFKGSIQVYPNPNTGLFSLRLNDSTEAEELEIYNSTGQLIVKKQWSELETNMDLTTESNGFYFIKLKYSNGFIDFGKILKKE